MSLGLVNVENGAWAKVRRNFNRLDGLLLGPNSTPSFSTVTVTGITTTTITVSGLTASRLVATNTSSNLTSVDPLTDWIAGTENEINVTDDGDGTVTLSTPQDIHTGASPTFAGLDLTGITDGRVPYMSASGFADSPFSYDGSNIGIGTVSPDSSTGLNVHIYGGSAGAVSAYNGSFLTIENDSFAYINILVPTDSYSGIRFGEDTNPSAAELTCDWTNDKLTLNIDSGDIYIDPSGNTYIQSDLIITDTVDASSGKVLVEDADTNEPTSESDGYLGVAYISSEGRIYFEVNGTMYYVTGTAAAIPVVSGMPIGLLLTLTYEIS